MTEHATYNVRHRSTPRGPAQKQEPFSRVAPLLRTALLMGACGGFVLATILTLTSALAVPLGPWWAAVAQAHGHVQLYGWAGLFVLGVAFHFLPRLRGAPLASASLLPWLLASLAASLILRMMSQSLLALSPHALIWQLLLLLSGVLEVVAFVGLLCLLLLTAIRGPRPSTRPAYWSVLPLLAGAFTAFGIAGLINLMNMIEAAFGSGQVPDAGDTLNVTLGLFGFLIPMALAMSARSLPMYAGLDGFPRRALWPIAFAYLGGVLLLCIGSASGVLPTRVTAIISSLGMILTGSMILLFVSLFLRLMAKRGRIPQRVSQLAPSPERLSQQYRRQVKTEQTKYGPFVALVASAYSWAMLGGLLLLLDGVSLLLTGTSLVAVDAIRHSFAIGFIALLLCGVAPRMIPSFSGGAIVSPHLVSTTLWLGNCAAVLRVGSILLAPLLASWYLNPVDTLIFGLSGPFGLALAICFAVNLWPALAPPSQHH
jgi:uncharacterized protein involved in response to NO